LLAENTLEQRDNFGAVLDDEYSGSFDRGEHRAPS